MTLERRKQYNLNMKNKGRTTIRSETQVRKFFFLSLKTHTRPALINAEDRAYRIHDGIVLLTVNRTDFEVNSEHN